MHGQVPNPDLSDFAVLAIVCNFRCRIGLFESLSSSTHMSLRLAFIDSINTTMDTLNQLLSDRGDNKQGPESEDHPLCRHARSALDSAFLHLYCSKELSNMQRLLRSPELSRAPQELSKLFEAPPSPHLRKGLYRTVQSLQLEFEAGINYLKIASPLRFDPLEVKVLCERGKKFLLNLLATRSLRKRLTGGHDRSTSVLVP